MREKIVLVGDSLIDYFPIESMYQGEHLIINCGEAGNTTEDILNRLELEVIPCQADRYFILAGTNDFTFGRESNRPEDIVKRIMKIGSRLESGLVYVISLLPINNSNHPKIYKPLQVGKNNEKIQKVNHFLKEACKEKGYVFIDLYPLLLDDENRLDLRFTTDGTHLTREAYQILFNEIKKYFT